VNARLLATGALAALLVTLGAALVATRGTDESVASVAGADPEPVPPTVPVSSGPDAPALPDRGVHPSLRDIDGWLQSDVSSLEELRGTVVAVQFWTFACSNCKATLPHMQELRAKYRDQGFEIVGVHAPEFEFEADVDNIVEAAAELGVTWPIVLDTAKQTFHSWQDGSRAFWPRVYLLDRQGHVRYDHIGEGRYAEIDAAVAALLAEPADP
jgi:thiol-disulfide isomerase/thioredoxin